MLLLKKENQIGRINRKRLVMPKDIEKENIDSMNNLEMSERARPLFERVVNHIRDNVDPISDEFYSIAESNKNRWSFTHRQLELLEGAKNKAKKSGLWNFFLPDSETGEGLSNLDYAYM